MGSLPASRAALSRARVPLPSSTTLYPIATDNTPAHENGLVEPAGKEVSEQEK